MKIADDIMYSLFKDEEPNNAIDLLKFDHRNVSAMFIECLKEDEPTRRRELVQVIVEELTLHSIAEEKLVYPILNVEDEFMSQEAYEEHHIIEMSLIEAASLQGTEANFKAKIKVLSKLVAHHVAEEESHMLSKVQHSDFDMRELGDKIKAEKESLRAAGIKKPSMPKAEPSNDATQVTTIKMPEELKPKAPIKSTHRKGKETVKATRAAAKSATKAKTATRSTKTHKKTEPKKTTAIKKQAAKKPTATRKAKASTSRGRSAA